jgi:hypothetical protein
MSIASDLRAYADAAREQSTQLVTKLGTTVGGLTAAANTAVEDLRIQAEQRLNLTRVRSAIDPYLVQAREYGANVSERAEGLYGTVRNDERVAGLVERAEGLYGTVRNDERVAGLVERAETVTRPVVELVQDRVVQPVQQRVVQPVRTRVRRDDGDIVPAAPDATAYAPGVPASGPAPDTAPAAEKAADFSD